MMLDGKEIKAILSTAASASYLYNSAARRLFDIHTDEPTGSEILLNPPSNSISVKPADHQFDKLELGGKIFHHPWIAISNKKFIGDEDLVLGMHQLRNLHLYISYKNKMPYATSSQPSQAEK